jgi:D-proline reductase (dithiol) PrdB
MPFSYVEMMTGFGLAEYAELPNFDPAVATPIGKPLSEARLGLFTSCGARMPNHRAFEPLNDLTFRMVPREAPVADVMFEHPTPVRGFAEQDLNVAYPRDRLVELEAEGVIGELAPSAVSMLGSITTYTKLVEQTVPVMADVFKDQDVDVVLLIPFCPACHRATSLIARGLEAHGVPCIQLTVLREMAQAFKPARPVFLDYPLGATAGRPNDPDNQRDILREALTEGSKLGDPWRVHDLEFEFAADGSRDWEKEIHAIYAEKGKEIHRARVAEHTEQGEKLAGREAEITLACAC